MTLPPVVRVFFAIEPSPAVKEEIGRFIGAMKKKSKSHAIRWTRPENLHITLQFIAEARAEHLPLLSERVRDNIAGKVPPSTVTFGGLHLFPNPYRPRVIVLEVVSQEILAVLSGLIGEGIATLGYELESRPFRAHLSLGRIKQPQGVDLSFLPEFSKQTHESMTVHEVTLFRSEPKPEGSVYTVVEKIALSG